MANLTAEALLELLLEVEKEDPIDYADLPYEEGDLRQLACLHVAEFLQSDDYRKMNEDEREKVMAATMAKLVLENMALHARLLMDKQ